MLRTHFRFALRHLRRHPGYTAINVAGLALGIGCCLLVFLYAREELRFDRFHDKIDRLFRVVAHEHRTDGDRSYANMPAPLAPTLAAELPGVARATRVMDGGAVVHHGDRVFREAVTFVDPAFLQMFSFPLVAGDPATALHDLNSVVLTEETARKFFGEAEAVGQVLTLQLAEAEAFVVTGVAAAPPNASSLSFDVLLRFEKNPDYAVTADAWDSATHQVFVELAPRARPADLNAALAPILRTYRADYVEYLNTHFRVPASERDVLRLQLQPMADIHFDTRFQEGRTGNPVFVYILIGIALLVLASGCINFINLSLGRIATRLKEVGVRKAVGASRQHLILQFWVETALLCLAALLLGIGLVESILPAFGRFLRTDLQLDFFSDPVLPAAVALLFFAITFIAGSYPAFHLAGFHPVDVLKGRLHVRGPGLFRRGLTAFQFALSILFISSTLVMVRQFTFLQEQDPGFVQEQVVTLPISGRADGDVLAERLRARLAAEPGVVSVGAASNALGLGPDGSTYRSVMTFMHLDTEIRAHLLRIDAGYLQTLGIPMVAGRPFAPDDSRSGILINETFARQLPEEEVVGLPLSGFELPSGETPVIRGVVQDFHFESLHHRIEPLLMHVDAGTPVRRLFIRIRPTGVPATLAALERHWTAVAPDVPFQYSFLDEDVDRQYRAVARQIQVATTAAGLAVLIACLGLFGLSVMAVNRRIKEIGIRKVLGASVTGLLLLVTREFLLLVGVAFVLAAPLAYFAAHGWLTQFAYRISVPWTIFLAAGLLTLLIALATVSYQAVRAARTNPVRALRYE